MIDMIKTSISEKFVLTVVLLNTIVFITLDTFPSVPDHVGSWIVWVDYFCVIFFVYEFIAKIIMLRPKSYFKDNWNKLDFIIVLGSIPILLEPFTSLLAVSWLPIVRVTRIFRLARFLRLSRLVRYTQKIEQLKKLRLPFYALLILVLINLINNFFELNSDFSNFLLTYYASAILAISTWLFSRAFSVMQLVFIDPALQKNSADATDAIEAIISAIGQVLIWAIGLALAVEAAGYSSLSIIAGLGFGGVAIALAAQDLIANILGGVMLYLQKPFEIGDTIRVSGSNGKVEKIGIRSLKIKSFSGKEISIPNKEMVSGIIENITSENLTKQSITIILSLKNSSSNLLIASNEVTKIAKKNDFIADDYSVRFGEMNQFGHRLIFDFYFDNRSLFDSDPDQLLFELVNFESSNIYIDIIDVIQKNGVLIRE